MPKRERDEEEDEVQVEERIRLSDLEFYNAKGPDHEWDEKFKQLVIDQTAPTQQPKKQKKAGKTWGEKNAKMIHAILQQATLPEVGTSTKPIRKEARTPVEEDEEGAEKRAEVLFLKSELAYNYLASDMFHVDLPVIVSEGVAAEYAVEEERPIETFFKWQEDHDRTLSVQVPSNLTSNNSYKVHTLKQVKDTFLYNDKQNNNDPEDEDFKNKTPWNVLDTQNPVPGTYPRFIQHHRCQLLHSIKSAVLGGMTAQRMEVTTATVAPWKDNVDWTLLSEGGNLTGPHMDAHGLDTWITVQEGAFGFGWMARPTPKEYLEWMQDPLRLTQSDKWRYLVLKPGQTVFFPGGLIHWVFRIKGYQTLATGGHNIRWNALEHWLDTMALQKQYEDTCNEEQDRINLFCDHVKHFIQKRIKHGTLEEVFGESVLIWGSENRRSPIDHANRIIEMIDDPEQPWNAAKKGKKAKKGAVKAKRAGAAANSKRR